MFGIPETQVFFNRKSIPTCYIYSYGFWNSYVYGKGGGEWWRQQLKKINCTRVENQFLVLQTAASNLLVIHIFTCDERCLKIRYVCAMIYETFQLLRWNFLYAGLFLFRSLTPPVLLYLTMASVVSLSAL